MNPRITVLMPVYNAMPHLCEAVESILAQTFTDFEFIIINDGSTDGSSAYLEHMASQDSRIALVSRENRGLIASLNQGIELAQGEFIARMDADDISAPNRLQRQLDTLDAMAADFCGCHFQLCTHHGELRDVYTVPTSPAGIWVYLVSAPPFAHGSVMIRREYLLRENVRYGQTPYRHAEDYAIWAQCAMAGARLVNVNELLFTYRISAGSLARTKQQQIFADTKAISKVVLRSKAKALTQSVQFMLTEPARSRREEMLLALAVLLLAKHRKAFFVLQMLRRIAPLQILKALALLLKRY